MSDDNDDTNRNRTLSDKIGTQGNNESNSK